MELNQVQTPQKKHNTTAVACIAPSLTENNITPPNSSSFATPNGRWNGQKPVHARTPNGDRMSYSFPSSISVLHSSSNASIITPPAKRFHQQPPPKRVRNPFEAALAERLHLPTIASPSLFQRPPTPQLSSTQFEWTIEQVSSLLPACVEPHETQFQESPDPEYEAKAQSAISSFFKEHQIVPSPVNCPLRQQRIILAEINSNTPVAKPGRRIRDFGTQTALSLPFDLPPAVEEALRPYFQPHLAGGYDEDAKPLSDTLNSSGNAQNASIKEVSFCRQLFDKHNIILFDGKSPHLPKMPQNGSSSSSSVEQRVPHTTIMRKLSDSSDKSICGSLSPISARDDLSISPHGGSGAAAAATQHVSEVGTYKRKSCRRSFLEELTETEQLSPIYAESDDHAESRQIALTTSSADRTSADMVTPAKTRRFCDELNYGDEANASKFTPDRSSSPLRSLHSSTSANGGGEGCNSTYASGITTESFRLRISRLVVNSGSKYAQAENIRHNETVDMPDNDDDAMQMSQLSCQSSNMSSGSLHSNCDTPRGNRRSASRKNLSQSFSATWLDDSNDNDDEDVECSNLSDTIADDDHEPSEDYTDCGSSTAKLKVPTLLMNENTAVAILTNSTIMTECYTANGDLRQQKEQQPQQQSLERTAFYRVDSGFNDTTTSSTSTGLLLLSQQDELSREALLTKNIDDDSQKNGFHGVSNMHKFDDLISNDDVSMSVCCSTPSKQ